MNESSPAKFDAVLRLPGEVFVTVSEPDKETDIPLSETVGHLMSSKGSQGCGPLIFDFRKLSQGRNEFFIRLDGETYRLQLTRNHKLILTK